MEQKHPVGTKDDATIGAERTATVPPVWLFSRIARLQTAKCAAMTERETEDLWFQCNSYYESPHKCAIVITRCGDEYNIKEQ